MIPPIWRAAGFAACGGFAEGSVRSALASRTSKYFSPLPVLNRTTVSSALKKLLARSLRYATRQAAPSGAAKMPSTLAQWRMASTISSSVAATAVPLLFFSMSRMR